MQIKKALEIAETETTEITESNLAYAYGLLLNKKRMGDNSAETRDALESVKGQILYMNGEIQASFFDESEPDEFSKFVLSHPVLVGVLTLLIACGMIAGIVILLIKYTGWFIFFGTMIIIILAILHKWKTK